MIARLPERLTPAEADPRGHLSGVDWLSRIASILLTAALVASVAFAFRMATVTREVAGRVDAGRMVTSYLRTAQYALAIEQSLERQYRLSPEGETFIANRVAATSLITAMDSLRALSGSEDRPEIDRILATHRAYLSDTRQLFVATNRGQTRLVELIQRDRVDVVFGEIDDAIDALAKTQTIEQERAIVELRETRDWFVDVTLALSLTGLCCLGCFLLIVKTYRARLERSHEAELRKLESSALLDGLTGIGNHRAYKQNLVREISRAERHGEALTLAILDIDDFKTVNDRDGHIAGDHLIASVATLLGSLRTEDQAYRVGGDRFAVILPNTTMHAASEVVERLQDAARHVMLGNTLSIGLATLNQLPGSAESLQAQAEAAMYAAKRSGRNTVAQYDEARDGKWLLSPSKVHSLRQLIAARSMDVVFQPIWDVRRCRILAYEALARPNPKYGFHSPQEAFDVAERIGRSHELDAVCREAALASAALLPAGVLLFVNVSPQSLDHGRLDPVRLVNAVVEAGLTPDRIVIEITERAVTQVEVLIEAALALRNHGFRLALDDTGAGNSGLEMLSRLPLDFVKIDREVIVRALVDRKARGVIAGIIAIANATDAYVIAEGIETKEMLTLVCGDATHADPSERIQGVQGYLLNRPRDTFLLAHEMHVPQALLQEFTFESGLSAPRPR
jgi:diguanylate cyclase (GGDEF)-like protein